MTTITRDAVEPTGLSVKFADRCKNFFAMGLVFWLYGRDVEPTLRFIENKFSSKPDVAEANRLALKAGWNFGETTENFASTFSVPAAELEPGVYKNVMGNQALAWGLIAAAELSGKELFLGSYPITPASDILHELAKHKNFGVRTFQAEDEIAAVCSAVGSWGQHGHHHKQRPRHRPQRRRYWSGTDFGTAVHHHRRSARRAKYRAANQDRTI